MYHVCAPMLNERQRENEVEKKFTLQCECVCWIKKSAAQTATTLTKRKWTKRRNERLVLMLGRCFVDFISKYVFYSISVRLQNPFGLGVFSIRFSSASILVSVAHRDRADTTNDTPSYHILNNRKEICCISLDKLLFFLSLWTRRYALRTFSEFSKFIYSVDFFMCNFYWNTKRQKYFVLNCALICCVLMLMRRQHGVALSSRLMCSVGNKYYQ